MKSKKPSSNRNFSNGKRTSSSFAQILQRTSHAKMPMISENWRMKLVLELMMMKPRTTTVV